MTGCINRKDEAESLKSEIYKLNEGFGGNILHSIHVELFK